MLNLAGMLKAPAHEYEVSMTRKPTTNESQNVRKRIAYVRANSEAEAKRLAERNHPAFKAEKARKA